VKLFILTRSHAPIAVPIGVAVSGFALACMHPRLVPQHYQPMIWLSGELRVVPDSVPLGAATITLMGGPDPDHVGLLAQTLTWRDGHFDLQVGGHTRIDCTTLRVLVRKIAYNAWESRSGQLRCDNRCQWLDITIARPTPLGDGIMPFDVSPVDCTWSDGYPGPKRPA
jgi:hypothetical protein